ncbi:permease [Halobacillus salinarum]|uniref:Permease n=1 Tax=Halobacillus salinarum TaxID=2932257 RepID=A0ABY4EQ26_9BACI|nr:permease [Halobacillus salinarum]UOQ45752.1 permease [Halobacillus salinarum]
MLVKTSNALIYFIFSLVFVAIFVAFVGGEFIPIEKYAALPQEILDINTLFLSIFLEAIPFVLIGVFISALIQSFIKEEHLQRFIPSNPILAIIPGVIIGAIFPICECAVVPIVRRLVQKGMPLHVGFVILVSAPILNPIVYLSTYYAFQSSHHVALERMGLAFVVSIILGLLIYCFYGDSNQLKGIHSSASGHHHPHKRIGKWKETMHHAIDEFFGMGKYLLFGSLVASVIQAFLARETLLNVGHGLVSGPSAMMGMAYVLSLCSEADAFVAASFKSVTSGTSLLAFLVYGPMIDLKNTILLFAYFKNKFVAGFLVLVTVVVFSVILLYSFWY